MFALMGALAKVSSPHVPTFELVAFRSGITWLVMDLVRRKARVPLEFFGYGILLSRSLAGFVGITCYFYALHYIPLGDAVLLNNASPVLTSLGAVLLLGERMTPVKALALCASLGGVWFLVDGRVTLAESRGAWVGAFSAVASAWALVSLKVATRRNRSVIVVWCLAATSTLGALCFFDSTWAWPADARQWALLLGTGLTAAAAQLLMTMGYRLLDASEASVYSYFTPVFAVLLGIVWFGDIPRAGTWLGGALIVASGTAVALASRAKPPLAASPL